MTGLRLFAGMVALLGLGIISAPGSAWGGVAPRVRGFGTPSQPAIARPGRQEIRHHFPFEHRFFLVLPTTVIVTSPIVSYPSAFDAPSSYESPAALDPPAPDAYGPPPPVALGPPTPATPSVIEYPTGRYELRGDGETSPYTWVWIPKPPPPPPAPPDGPPATPQKAPADRAARASEGRPAPSDELYRWTDGTGVTHWTNMPGAVPEGYRSQVGRPVQLGDGHV